MSGLIKTVCFISLSLLCSIVHAAGFDSGSNGSYGAILVDNSTGNVTIDLPPDGIIHATTVTVKDGFDLTFKKNVLNTPVYLLATGNITIDRSGGRIRVNAQGPTALSGGAGGPGGFDGGKPGIAGALPGAGYGPGAGLGAGLNDSGVAGNAGYGTNGGTGALDGSSYGNQLLVPILGGSGAGGIKGKGGGGGGGAIVIASNTRIDIAISGSISAEGSRTARGKGAGSGGAIRLVAPVIAGFGTLLTRGGEDIRTLSAGRMRVDLLDRSEFALRFAPSSAVAIGSYMKVFPDIPHLDIISVAGNVIAEGTSDPVIVTLPFNAPTNQPVTVQATGFNSLVPVRVVFTPDSGDPIVADGEIDMSSGGPASVTLNADLPQNMTLRVHAWTR